MTLRNQLLVINMLSHGVMVAALLYSYNQMLLTFEQARLLTGISCLAAVVSMLAYWFMTLPIIRSIRSLMLLTKQLSRRQFTQVHITEQGPQEFKQLAHAFQQMGDKLEQSFKQLEEGEKARRELIANISHDLRTPIAAIQSMIEALQDNLIEDRTTKERYLTTMLKEVKRLSQLINDLFELSKLEARQEVFQPQLSHLDTVLLEVLDAHAILLQDKKIHVHVEVPDTLPALWMMPTKIARVLSNLLQNAIRYSPISGELELIVKQDEPNNQVEIVLRDEGEGIGPEDRLRIFERFFRTEHSRNKELGGSGLGLAIAKSLVELHQGQIGVRERTDGKQGSEFWFTLPLRLDQNES
jgi:two-component system sensor histidine kinase SaeS